MVEVAPSATCALDLLGSPELHSVVSDNLMDVGRGFLGSVDRDLVQATVADVFANVTRALDKQAPDAAKALRRVQLSDSLRAALLHLVRLLSDAKVQRVGLGAAEAIRDGGSQEPADALRHIRERLRGQEEEIGLVRRLLPAALRGSAPLASGLSELALGADNLRAMATVDGSWAIEDAEPRDEPSVPEWYSALPKLPAEDDYRRRLDFVHETSSRNPFWRVDSFQTEASDQTEGVREGVKEQSRVLLAILGHLPRERRHRDAVVEPEVARAAMDLPLEFVSTETSEQVSCGAGTQHAMTCLLKFGTQGLAALYLSRADEA